MSTSDKSQAKDFLLGNMADYLLSLTLDLCGRKDSSTPRFPRLLYDSYWIGLKITQEALV